MLPSFKDNFTKSLESLDLQAIILVIGLLSQRALELMMKEKKSSAALLKPDTSVA